MCNTFLHTFSPAFNACIRVAGPGELLPKQGEARAQAGMREQLRNCAWALEDAEDLPEPAMRAVVREVRGKLADGTSESRTRVELVVNASRGQHRGSRTLPWGQARRPEGKIVPPGLRS